MRRQDVANYWGGGVGIILVYNRGLSEQEITQNWDFQRSRFGL